MEVNRTAIERDYRKLVQLARARLFGSEQDRFIHPDRPRTLDMTFEAKVATNGLSDEELQERIDVTLPLPAFPGGRMEECLGAGAGGVLRMQPAPTSNNMMLLIEAIAGLQEHNRALEEALLALDAKVSELEEALVHLPGISAAFESAGSEFRSLAQSSAGAV